MGYLLHRPSRGVAALLLAITLVSSCGRPTSSSTADPVAAGLVQAQHSECTATGATVLHYLFTGDTSSDPHLDATYAIKRSEILASPAGARGALARQVADAALTACDEQRSAAESAASASASQESAAASNAAAAQARNTRMTDFCRGVHGKAETDLMGDVMCYVDYPGFPHTIVLDPSEGSEATQMLVAVNRQQRQQYTRQADEAAAGVRWKIRPKFHDDTGVCTEGRAA